MTDWDGIERRKHPRVRKRIDRLMGSCEDAMERVELAIRKMWRAIFGIGLVLILTAAALTYLFRDVETTSDRASTASQLADKTAQRAAALAAQNLRQDVDVVQSLRYSCRGLNQLRENQGNGLRRTIRERRRAVRRTRRLLKTPGGLARLGFPSQELRRLTVRAMERDRALITQLQEQVDELRGHTAEFRVKNRPYLVDCEKAHPFP